MKNLKIVKVIFIIILVSLNIGCHQFNIENIDSVEIIQIRNIDNMKTENVVYYGSAKNVKPFLIELSKIKSTWISFVIKEALLEGEYLIFLYSNDQMIGKYRIINSENIVDEITKKYYYGKLLKFIPE